MFPGTSIETGAPKATGTTASGEFVTIDPAALDSALAGAGYAKAADVSRIVDATLNEMARPAKFVPPAAWDPILVDDISPPNIPYTKYSPPVSGDGRPGMISSEGLTLGGTSASGRPTLAGDGIAGSIYDRLDDLRKRIRGDAEAPPPKIPLDLEDLNTTLGMIGIRLDDLEENAVALPILDPLKGGILSNFDGLSSLAFAPNFGLESIINRLDECCVSNNSYSRTLRGALLRLVLRTDNLNEIFDELARELEGVRVIAGMGTPLEVVKAEAERLAKFWAQNYATGTLARFLGGLDFVHEGDNWFGNELAQRDVLTGVSIKGFDLIKQPFLKGGVVDTGRIGYLGQLLDNKDAIIGAVPKSREAWSALFTDTITVGVSSFTGLKDAVENMAPGVGLPDVAGIDGTWITKFMNRAKGLKPLNALPPFFRDILNVRNLDLLGPGNAKALLEGQFAKISGLFGAMQEDQYDRQYTFYYSFHYRDPTGIFETSLEMGYFKQNGLAGFVVNATKHIKDRVDGDPPTWSTAADRLGEIRKLGKELATKYAGYAEGAFNDVAKSFGFSGTEGIRGVDFTVGDWNPSFNTGLDKIDDALGRLPTSVPLGWGV